MLPRDRLHDALDRGRLPSDEGTGASLSRARDGNVRRRDLSLRFDPRCERSIFPISAACAIEKSAAVPDARRPHGASHGAPAFRRNALDGWLRSRDFAAAIRAQRPFVVEVSPSSASPSMRRSGFPRRCTSRARRRRPTSATNIFMGTSPRKHRPREPLWHAGARQSRERAMKRDAECRGAPRHRAFETCAVADDVLEDASARESFSRAMQSESRNSRRFRDESSPARTCIDTLRRRFDRSDPSWSSNAVIDSTKARPPSKPREGQRHVREPRVPFVVVRLRARRDCSPIALQVGRRVHREVGRVASMPS